MMICTKRRRENKRWTRKHYLGRPNTDECVCVCVCVLALAKGGNSCQCVLHGRRLRARAAAAATAAAAAAAAPFFLALAANDRQKATRTAPMQFAREQKFASPEEG